MVSASMRLRKGMDGRKLALEAAFFRGQGQAGDRLEFFQRASCDLATVDEFVELPERITGILGSEIVLRAEHPPARLTLSAGDGTERVEAAGDRRQETPFGFDVGGDHPESGRLRLAGAMATTQALDGDAGAPAGFEEAEDAGAGSSRQDRKW